MTLKLYINLGRLAADAWDVLQGLFVRANVIPRSHEESDWDLGDVLKRHERRLYLSLIPIGSILLETVHSTVHCPKLLRLH